MSEPVYVELSLTEADKVEEWLGREHARALGKPYPIAPDTWVGPPHVPPEAVFVRFYARAYRVDQVAVLQVTDEMHSFATSPQTLTTGETYSYDLAANAKPVEQLSSAAQQLLQAMAAALGP